MAEAIARYSHRALPAEIREMLTAAEAVAASDALENTDPSDSDRLSTACEVFEGISGTGRDIGDELFSRPHKT